MASEKPWQPNEPPGDLVLTNVNVVDTENLNIIPDAQVHISQGSITSVSGGGSACADKSSSSFESSVDLKSAYLCPGLIDLHVHLTAAPGQSSFSTLFSQDETAIALRAAYVAKRMLLRGFTTVRDTGGSNASLRSAIAENLIPGPRLFIAGKALSQSGGHADLRAAWQGDEFKCCDARTPGFGRICDGVPACLEAARDELRRGADFLKVMCGGGVVSESDPLGMIQFTSDELKAITETASSIGTYVTAHAYTDAAVRHAVSNGCKGIEHGNFITEETVNWLKSHHPDTVITPTLSTYRAMSLPENRTMFSHEAQRKNQKVLDSGLQSIQLFKKAGITMGFGTDLLAHMHELQNTEFGIRGSVLDASEVLKQATVNSAKVLGMEGKLGVIKAGAYADLLVLRRNPLEDVQACENMTENCMGILKEGRVMMSNLKGLQVDEVYK